jgi:hypothetical protein
MVRGIGRSASSAPLHDAGAFSVRRVSWHWRWRWCSSGVGHHTCSGRRCSPPRMHIMHAGCVCCGHPAPQGSQHSLELRIRHEGLRGACARASRYGGDVSRVGARWHEMQERLQAVDAPVNGTASAASMAATLSIASRAAFCAGGVDWLDRENRREPSTAGLALTMVSSTASSGTARWRRVSMFTLSRMTAVVCTQPIHVR